MVEADRDKRRVLGRRTLALGVTVLAAFAAWPHPVAGGIVSAALGGLPAADLLREQRTTTLSVSISAPGPEVDAGVPFTLAATVVGGIPPFEYLWNSPTEGSATQADWTLTLASTLTISVELIVSDAAGALGTANVSLTAVDPPILTASGVPMTGDLGVPVAIDFGITGGVPPYVLVWAVNGNGSGGSAAVDGPGTVPEPIWSNRTGPTWVSASVLDSVGGRAAVSAACTSFVQPPVLTGGVPAAAVEAGQPFTVVGLVEGGSPPINWTLETLAPLGNGTARSGQLPATGMFEWTGTVASPGNFTIGVAAWDHAGVRTNATIPLSVHPRVGVELAVLGPSPSVGSSLPVSLEVTDGCAPFEYSIQMSDGESASGNLTSASPVDWNATPRLPGYLLVTATVRDGAGASVETSQTVLVGAESITNRTTAATPASDVTAIIVGTGFIGVLVAAVVVVLRRRRARPDPAAASTSVRAAIDVVTRLLTTGGETDAETLVYFAEEEGIDAASARAAVNALVAQGRIRRESSPAGEHLVWVADSVRDDRSDPEAA